MESLTAREKFLLVQEGFRENALKIITQMLAWSNTTPGSKHLVDEILHSIFFLGGINKPKYEPKDIVTDDNMMNMLKGQYPRPLQYYVSQLPKRSPFSCVLDMIVLQEGKSQIDKIKERVHEFADRLKPGFLVSTTMCVTTCKTSNSNYYGVSMSTTGPNAGKIVIAASSLSTWEEYVAGAVMTYYPEKASEKYKKKEYFDGTIKLPLDKVTCQASNIKNQTNMEPCRSCGNLFGLPTKDTKEWPYGHCAEVGSVSNLLKAEKAVKEAAAPTSPTYTAENREKAEASVRMVLKQVLKMVDFKWVGDVFYEPQN
ncbi:uncharacterized protein LOC114865913 [Betta splendens]|uniref:Uncharacterized protein LOC114865913 n=1 Tax=Betta splendens TaxID=158456 RepID=A0A6P7P0Q5_BETSP|nr:uncharacterized protein LOC114865913 [Betta splendens]